MPEGSGPSARRPRLVALIEASHVASGTYRVDLVPTDTKDKHIVFTALEGSAGMIPPIQVVDANAFARQLRLW